VKNPKKMVKNSMIKKFGYYQALNMDNLVKMQIWTFYAISEA
jgi:hypothetical protein